MTTETTQVSTSDPSVGATPSDAWAWHAINWRHAQRNVHRLQTRITQATLQGKWGKVKALQRLLTHSFSGKALAVRRVTENTGKRTPGVDGQTWKTPEQKAEAIHSLQQRGYHPQPLRRIYIPKSNGRRRALGIPVVVDRCLQSMVKNALEPAWEARFEGSSYGFRPGRDCHDAIGKIYELARPNKTKKWVLDADIRGAFDHAS